MNHFKKQAVFRIFFALLLVSAASFQVKSQHQFGLNLGVGMSQIIVSDPTPWESQSDSWEPSVRGGVFYTYNPITKVRLTADLGVTQINGTRRRGGPVDYNGVDEVEGETTLRRNLTYLTFSLSAGYQLGPVALDVGFQSGYNIAGKEDVDGELTFLANDSVSTFGSNGRELELNQLDFGPRIALLYQINDRFALEGTYYYGLTNLSNENTRANITWRAQRVGLGLRCGLWQLPKEVPAEE